MIDTWWLVPTLFVGVFVGIVIMALCFIAKQSDEQQPKHPPRGFTIEGDTVT